jgi:hypothetical protein
MKRNSVLAFVACGLFLLAAILNMVNGASFKGAICIIGAISFFLAGYHWRRKGTGGQA